MNAHALTVLEFGRALELVAGRAASQPGKEHILSLRPGTALEPLRAELARVGETLLHLERHPDWAPPPFPDFRESLARLDLEGSVLGPAELRDTIRLLHASRELSSGLADAGAQGEAGTAKAPGPSRQAPPGLGPSALRELRRRLLSRRDLEASLDRIVDEEGGVRDDASPALSSIRRGLRETRGKIVRKLEKYLAGLPDRFRVEDASVSIRDGRYVISVRREGKGDVGGIVHGESASGATLFIEPPLAIELANELHELERTEAREIQRILRETTDLLRPARAELGDAFDAQVELDTLWARALTARRWSGVPPELVPPADQALRVVEARHPLLVEQGIPVVPFFLELGGDERAVVISGPNTGGKTVLLKAMGLIHALAQSGVVPPVAEGTRLPLVEDIFADIGDEQSLAASLSTFSAHLANVREILDGAGPRSLVLVDEMGTGTDPSEGAALARALLEVLVERGARVFATSHLGALKRLDVEGSGIVNASLLFDAGRIEPTYTLQKGLPGRSYGLAIARRLGLPAEVLDRAEGYVDAGELRLETLLATLEEKERQLSEALRRAEAAQREALEVQGEAEARRERLDDRERTAEARAREQARRLLLEAREEVEEAIREVRTAHGAAADEVEGEARPPLATAARALRAPAPEQRSSGAFEDPPRVHEGDRVELVGSGARGVVRGLTDERVTVEVGGMRLSVPLREVAPVAGGGESPRPDAPRGRVPAMSGAGWSAPEVEARLEANLRGLRVDEVAMALGRALDGAIVGNLSELRVIHGKGTGAVKSRVQELLRQDLRVAVFRPGGEGEGGSGVTVVTLR
ncbi:MAG: Smr/MutS family protein [Gemmatimonadota bacterium]